MKVLLPSILLLFAAASAAAVSLSDYSSRIGAAAETADQLAKNGAAGAAFDMGVQRIRELVPASEHIDYPGGGVTTDNSAIHLALDLLIADNDRSKRAEALTALSDRLRAIDDAVKQLETPTGGTSPQEQKRKLEEILNRPEYRRAGMPEESTFARWQREFWEWLARVFPRPQASTAPPVGMGSIRLALQILIFVAIVSLIGFLLYRFTRSLGWSPKEKKTKRSQRRMILGEEVSAEETAEDLFAEAERLAREGQIRPAIRRAYIAALCDLGDRRILRLANHKTNRDYVRELRPNAAGYGTFADLTGVFERNWYGSRPADVSEWERFCRLYRETLSTVRSPAV